MGIDKKAKHAVTRARTVLLVSQPFYGTLALQLELVEVTDKSFVNTMAVDGRHLFYNPEFVLSLTEDELVGVNAHEVAHCAFQHMTRRGHRDPRLWNVAGDYAINADLLDAGFVLPKLAKAVATMKVKAAAPVLTASGAFRTMVAAVACSTQAAKGTKASKPRSKPSGKGMSGRLRRSPRKTQARCLRTFSG